jgi:hypothetical protein
MPGIGRFRGQAKVGNSQIIDDGGLVLETRKVSLGPNGSMGKHQTEKQKVTQDEQQKFIGCSPRTTPGVCRMGVKLGQAAIQGQSCRSRLIRNKLPQGLRPLLFSKGKGNLVPG